MKRRLCLLITLLLILGLCGCGAAQEDAAVTEGTEEVIAVMELEGEAEETTAPEVTEEAAPVVEEIVIESEESDSPERQSYVMKAKDSKLYPDLEYRFDVLDAGITPSMQAWIKIENTGDSIIDLWNLTYEGSSYWILDSESTEIHNDFFNGTFPLMLYPGEVGYIWDNTFLDDYDCDEVELRFRFAPENRMHPIESTEDHTFDLQPAEISLTPLSNGDIELYVSVTNTLDIDVRINYKVLFLNAEGKVLTFGGGNPEIPAGETIWDTEIIDGDSEFIPAECYIYAYH